MCGISSRCQACGSKIGRNDGYLPLSAGRKGRWHPQAVPHLHYNGSMQYPQILVYETGGLLVAMLGEMAKAKWWALREPRKAESCLRLLRSLCPSVLVLKIATYAPRAERSVVLSRPQQGIAQLA